MSTQLTTRLGGMEYQLNFVLVNEKGHNLYYSFWLDSPKVPKIIYVINGVYRSNYRSIFNYIFPNYLTWFMLVIYEYYIEWIIS